MKLGIVGLPNVGKKYPDSNSLTKAGAEFSELSVLYH